ncbi:MAG: transposase [Pseudomonadota bacterium]
MATPIKRTEPIEIGGSTPTLKGANNCAQTCRGRVFQKKMDMVCLSAKLNNGATNVSGNGQEGFAEKRKVVENFSAELSAKNNMDGQRINTVTCTVKVKVPDSFVPALNSLRQRSALAVQEMLSHREKTSSKYYTAIPCVVAKSLVAKYQRNRKCKSVSSVVIPICGDKGRQIKIEGAGVRVPALFKKEILPVMWMRPVIGVIRSAEFLQRDGKWYAHITYNTPADPMVKPSGMIGVDRNSVGAVATMADPQNGKVFHLGFNPAPTKEVWRRRKGNLQRAGKMRLLHRIKDKQAKRTKHENHLVSKQIVDYATKHCRAIAVEKLENVNRGKIARYAQRSQWSFYQLLQFILYKAALRGVMVIEVDPAYTSQECSRCHKLSKPNGKIFRCAHCGHNDHRDANAAFSISQRVSPIGGMVRESERPRRGLLVAPFPGTEVQQCI